MKRNFSFLMALLGVCTLSAAPHVGFLLPSGGRTGTCVNVVVGGQGLAGAGASVSGTGVTVEDVEIIPSFPRINGSQVRYLHKWIDAVRTGNPEPPAKTGDTSTWRKHPFFDRIDQLTPLEMHLLIDDIVMPRNPLQMSPAIRQRAIVRLRIAPDATPGKREFRLLSKGRISNPMPFFVGSDPEFQEPAADFKPRSSQPVAVRFPGAVNGQIMPGEVDRYDFDAVQGDVLTFTGRGRELSPFLGDCVPGHFQLVLEILDADGRRVALADDFHFNPDPKLTFSAPRSGRYRLVVRDALYRGRADFVYRIEARSGKEPFSLAPLPERIAGLPRAGAELLGKEVPFPVLIEGVFSGRKQRDAYCVALKKGEVLMAEVFARRLGSPVDSVLTIRDRSGKILNWCDDYKNFGPNLPPVLPEKDEKCIASTSSFQSFLVGTTLHQADSRLRFTAPRDGVYRVEVRDSACGCGPDHRYYLRLDRPRPGFRLYYSPSGWEVPMGGALPVRFVVERFDGFDGEITLEGLPQYFHWTGCAAIPRGADYAWLTVSGEPKGRNPSLPKPFAIHGVSGKIRGDAIPCDEAMQAFAYTHLIPAQQSWCIRKWWNGRQQIPTPGQEIPVLMPGKETSLRFLLKGLPPGSSAVIELADAPAGVTAATLPDGDGWRVTLKAAPNYKPAERNVLFQAVLNFETPSPKEPGKKVRKTERFYLPVQRIRAER